MKPGRSFHNHRNLQGNSQFLVIVYLNSKYLWNFNAKYCKRSLKH